jgi:hypothetical protein
MMGSSNEPGIIPLAIDELFSYIHKVRFFSFLAQIASADRLIRAHDCSKIRIARTLCVFPFSKSTTNNFVIFSPLPHLLLHLPRTHQLDNPR